MTNFSIAYLDGWTKTDLIYVWDDRGSSALQIAPNMSLPGGFKLRMYGQEYADVKTNTGQYSCLQVSSTYLMIMNHVKQIQDYLTKT